MLPQDLLAGGGFLGGFLLHSSFVFLGLASGLESKLLGIRKLDLWSLDFLSQGGEKFKGDGGGIGGRRGGEGLVSNFGQGGEKFEGGGIGGRCGGEGLVCNFDGELVFHSLLCTVQREHFQTVVRGVLGRVVLKAEIIDVAALRSCQGGG